MSARKRIPPSASSTNTINKCPVAQLVDYSNSFPCWRFSSFDKDGPWGLDALLNFTFRYSEATFQAVFNSGIQEIDNALGKIKGRQVRNRREFWDLVRSFCKSDIPIEIIERIEDEIVRNTFTEKIYPKLIQFEKITWDEIRLQTHSSKGCMKSNNHDIDVSDLCQEAKKRLRMLKLNDRDKIYSLRLEGTVRVLGFRVQNCLDIIWVDLNHEVCPVSK